MKTVYTKDLTGVALDYAVAIANGIPAEDLRLPTWEGALYRYQRDEEGNLNGRYMTGPDLLFSRKWEAGGPIIAREGIDFENGGTYAVIDRDRDGAWTARGPNHLVAAMRCFVASKLGDTVEIPEELT